MILQLEDDSAIILTLAVTQQKEHRQQQQFIISFSVLTKHTYSLDSCTKHKQHVLRYLAGRKLSINEQTHIWNYINYTLYNKLKI